MALVFCRVVRRGFHIFGFLHDPFSSFSIDVSNQTNLMDQTSFCHHVERSGYSLLPGDHITQFPGQLGPTFHEKCPVKRATLLKRRDLPNGFLINNLRLPISFMVYQGSQPGFKHHISCKFISTFLTSFLYLICEAVGFPNT